MHDYFVYLSISRLFGNEKSIFIFTRQNLVWLPYIHDFQRVNEKLGECHAVPTEQLVDPTKKTYSWQQLLPFQFSSASPCIPSKHKSPRNYKIKQLLHYYVARGINQRQKGGRGRSWKTLRAFVVSKSCLPFPLARHCRYIRNGETTTTTMTTTMTTRPAYLKGSEFTRVSIVLLPRIISPGEKVISCVSFLCWKGNGEEERRCAQVRAECNVGKEKCRKGESARADFIRDAFSLLARNDYLTSATWFQFPPVATWISFL